jgi:peroxiredoxin Q/BCP
MTTAPKQGQAVPSFHVKDSQGNTLSSGALLGQSYVLYFYPKDGTPGCTAEACAFRDSKNSFDNLNALVIGVSPDSSESHDQFISEHQLNFSLVADSSQELCKRFGVWQEKESAGEKNWGVVRSTFVIDPSGVIAWLEQPVNVEGHAERVLKALETLK